MSCSNTINYFIQVIYLQSQHKIVTKLFRHLLVGYRIAAITRDSHGWQHHGSNHTLLLSGSNHEVEHVSQRSSQWKESNQMVSNIINLLLSVLVTIIIRCTVRIRLRVPQNK